jgi:hypothetical protein
MFKQIGSDKFSTREYEASKKWKLDDSSDAFTFHAGANVEFDNQNPTRNESGTSISAVYELIRHLYYRQNGNAYDRFGVLDLSQIDLSTFPTDERSIIYVLKISSQYFGKRIQPGSIEITTEQNEDSLTAIDDGEGNLVVKGQNTLIGNVFYQTGTLVLTKRPESLFQLPQVTVWPNYTFEDLVFDEQATSTGFPDYEFDAFDLLFRDFDIEFESTVSNFENQVSAEIESDEFGATTNPSIRNSNENVQEDVVEDNIRPYVTTVGYYNDKFELLATGKLSRPIQLSENTPLNIIGRFDT